MSRIRTHPSALGKGEDAVLSWTFFFEFIGPNLSTLVRMDHQKFSRTVELNVQGTIGVQKRVPLPQKRFFGTQFN